MLAAQRRGSCRSVPQAGRCSKSCTFSALYFILNSTAPFKDCCSTENITKVAGNWQVIQTLCYVIFQKPTRRLYERSKIVLVKLANRFNGSLRDVFQKTQKCYNNACLTHTLCRVLYAQESLYVCYRGYFYASELR